MLPLLTQDRPQDGRTGVGGADLDRIRGLAVAADALAAPELALEAEELAERAAAGLFYLACVGDFKRGKSTLLNALLGGPVLPAGLLPVTAVPTIVRFGGTAGATVTFRDGSTLDIPTSRLADYVAEAGNPGNRRDVRAVEVRDPSALLGGGLCLVDTPGLGSVIDSASALTRDFVPHIDAALAVVGVDPPVSQQEAELVEAIGRQTDHLIVVISKADRFTPRELAEAAGFARQVLARKLGRPVEVLCVSAARALAGGAGDPGGEGDRDDRGDDVARSDRAREGAGDDRAPDTGGAGWPVLVERLRRLALEKRQALVEAGLRRGERRLAAHLLAEVDRRLEALLRPLEESEREIEALRACLADLDRQLLYLDQQLAAEHGQLRSTLVADRQAFLEESLPVVLREVDAGLRASAGLPRPALHAAALAVAERAVRGRLEPWLEAEERKARALYGTVVGRFAQLAGGFVARAARMDESLALPDLEDDPPELLRRGGAYYFHSLAAEFYDRIPLIGLLRRTLPRRRVWRSAHARALRYAERLMDVNSARVQNSLDAGVRESRRALGVAIRRMLAGARASAERALEAARVARAAGSEAVADELARLGELRARIAGAEPAGDEAEARSGPV